MIKQIVEKKGSDVDNSFDLPTELSKPTKNMQTAILYGLPKCGKTTLLSKLPNCLIIDTENGSNKVSGLIKKLPDNVGPVGKMKWLEDFADFLIKQGRPYDYVAIDTFSEVNDMAEWSGTYRYMNSTQGQKFNREKDEEGEPIKKGAMLKPSDPDYESVHAIGEGFGYRWSREDTLRVFEKYTRVAKKCVFFVCHVEDKFLAFKEKAQVVPRQLALTGKVRDILPRKVDAIGYVYNQDGVIKINFTGNEERVGGNRCKHLQGFNDVADWNKIFIEE
jgi:hypothetical protein